MLYKLQHKFQHWRFHKKAIGTPLQPLYEQPLIKARQKFADTRFLVLDCEMSGLDLKSCQLLSLGWTAVEFTACWIAVSRVRPAWPRC